MDNSQELQEKDINIRELIKPYLDRWLWFVVGAFLALLGGYLFIKLSTPIYRTETTILVKDAKNNKLPEGASGLFDLSGIGGMNVNSIENEIEILKSKKLIEQVVKDLGLTAEVYQEAAFTKKELYKDTSPIIINVIGEKNPELEVNNKYNGFVVKNIYEDTKNTNEKRYQFTDKYDVLIQKSEITEKEIYTLVTKRDLLKNSKSKIM